MPKFTLADHDTKQLLNDLLFEFQDAHEGTYHQIIDSKLRIDVLFAHGDRDEDGNLTSDAITHHGVKALGLCSVINLKNRAAGRGDVEILLDCDFWETAGNNARRALLDHELFHIDFKREQDGSIKRDDLSRPLVRMRPHDYDFGWFATIAARHGDASMERQQAKILWDENNQAFFGDFMEAAKGLRQSTVGTFVESMKKSLGKGGSMTISSGDHSATIEGE